MIKRILLFLVYPYVFVHASISGEYQLSQESTKNYFMSTHFEEIIRFEPLHFTSNALNTKSARYINDISKKIASYTQDEREITISIIGHSDSGTNDLLKSESYAKYVQSYFKDKGIDTQLTVIESRGSKDSLFNSPNLLSDRVLVSIYVKIDQDQDKDGVLMLYDDCPNTKFGLKVSENGCKISTIVMLMDNNKENNAIAVTSGKQEVLINEPNTFTSIRSKNDMSRVSQMSDEEIKSLFANVVSNSNIEHFKFILYFQKENILENSQKELTDMIHLISQKDDYYIKVSGHADTIGSLKDNLKLSQKRVDIVIEKMKENKVQYFHLSTAAHGENQLAIPTPDNVNEPLNRRVEISIH